VLPRAPVPGFLSTADLLKSQCKIKLVLMKTSFRRHIRHLLAMVLSLAGVLPSPGTVGDQYVVDWPAIHLTGGFSLDVGSGFGSYLSSSASGTYGGLNGNFNANWNQVQFSAQANFAELTFIWDQGFTSYAVSPAYVGRPSPWNDANEAWHDLIIKGATEGLYISMVPEPAAVAFVAGLPVLLMLRRRRQV
jgi:hypothetical protein